MKNKEEKKYFFVKESIL